jgi:hypothetical protein
MARIAMEEPVGLARPGVDVSVVTADDERVSLEDADGALLHRHETSVQSHPRRVRRRPHAAQRDGVRNAIIFLLEPARTINQAAIAATIVGVVC